MFDLDLATIAFEIVNFLVLSALLYRFLLQPVMRRIEERAAEKKRLMQEMAQERDEAEALKAEWQAQMAQVETEAAEIIGQAEGTAAQQAAALRREAYAEAERVLVQAQLEAARWREQALAEFHDAMLDTILDVSAQVMARAAPACVHDSLLQELSEHIWAMGREEMQRVETIRRSLRDREPTVYVTTARPLTTTQQGQLVRTFTALVDRNVSLKIHTDPGLAAGLRIRLGDMIVENSLSGQLGDLREQAAEALVSAMPDPELEGGEGLALENGYG